MNLNKALKKASVDLLKNEEAYLKALKKFGGSEKLFQENMITAAKRRAQGPNRAERRAMYKAKNSKKNKYA